MKVKLDAIPIFKGHIELWEPVFYIRGCMFKVDCPHCFFTKDQARTWIKLLVRNGNKGNNRVTP